MNLMINVGVSARHIHLCKQDFNLLFGDSELKSIKDLSQDGEFASNQVLSIKTNKNVIDNVRVIGPLRDKTQVEISASDAYSLGLNPPVRMSGDLKDAVDVTLCNGDIEILCKNSCILANRHIHINSKDMNRYNLYDGDSVSVKINGKRGGVLDNVLVKSKENYNLELHLDTDEANAMGIRNGDSVEVINKGE